MSRPLIYASCFLLIAARSLAAAPREPDESQKTTAKAVEREAALARMLSGATLDGTYTNTAPGSDPAKLSRDKYTLGNVRKIGGHNWLIEARIEYGEHDVTLPITVPIHWAGDTPVIVVDNLGLPPFGTVSARVMFFANHYAGYWKHGEHGGHLFGVIKPIKEQPAPPSRDSSRDEQKNQ